MEQGIHTQGREGVYVGSVVELQNTGLAEA